MAMKWVLDYTSGNEFVLFDTDGNAVPPSDLVDPTLSPSYTYGSLITLNAFNQMKKLQQAFYQDTTPAIPESIDYSLSSVKFVLGLGSTKEVPSGTNMVGLRVHYGLMKWGAPSSVATDYSQKVILTGYDICGDNVYPSSLGGLDFKFLAADNIVVGIEAGTDTFQSPDGQCGDPCGHGHK